MNYSQDFDGNEIESTTIEYPNYAVIFNRSLFGNQGIVVDKIYFENKYLGTAFGCNIRNSYSIKKSINFNSIWLIGAKKTLQLMPDDNLFYLLDSKQLYAFSYEDFELTEFHSNRFELTEFHSNRDVLGGLTFYQNYNSISYLEKETTVFDESISINIGIEISYFYHDTGAHPAMVYEFRYSLREELEMIKRRLTKTIRKPTWKPTEHHRKA